MWQEAFEWLAAFEAKNSENWVATLIFKYTLQEDTHYGN
jgi:hypothetical protein